MNITGTAIVDRPVDMDRARGAVATIKLYGPRGGYIGATMITRDNAREVISRLQSFADAKPADRLQEVYTVDVGDQEHGLWVFEDPDDAAAFYEVRRANGYQADLGDQIVIDREAAETIIADEMAEADDNTGAA